MKEDLLWFLWEQRYVPVNLFTTTNLPVQVLQFGYRNRDAGPDFLQCRLRIGEVEWVGTVEMHLKSSEWYRHKHQNDPLYESVILHVVWQHDREVLRSDGTTLPVVVCNDWAPPSLIAKYEFLMSRKAAIPCAGLLKNVDDLVKLQAMEGAYVDRMQERLAQVTGLLHHYHGDREKVAFAQLFRYMGGHINHDAMSTLAMFIPYNLLKSYKESRVKVEALLFGYAGFLEQEKEDEYFDVLKKEWSFLYHKHGGEIMLPQEWKFYQIRPAAFPTLRIALLAALLSVQEHLFDHLTRCEDPADLRKLLSLRWDGYWAEHYDFAKAGYGLKGILGQDLLNTLFINVVIPLRMLRESQSGDQEGIEKSLSLLSQLRPENNRIIRIFRQEEWWAENAMDSQGLLQLYNKKCSTHTCLECPVATTLLKRGN